MTDNEIIKALHCCILEDCDNCKHSFGNCQVNLMLESLSLINRQKAEIERLQGYNENLQTANTDLSNEILDIKAEAIKEFADRLKEFVKMNTIQTTFFGGKCFICEEIVDDLVEEMGGNNND